MSRARQTLWRTVSPAESTAPASTAGSVNDKTTCARALKEKVRGVLFGTEGDDISVRVPFSDAKQTNAVRCRATIGFRTAYEFNWSSTP